MRTLRHHQIGGRPDRAFARCYRRHDVGHLVGSCGSPDELERLDARQATCAVLRRTGSAPDLPRSSRRSSRASGRPYRPR